MQTVPGTIGACTKTDLRDAVNALDDWITNSAPALGAGGRGFESLCPDQNSHRDDD